MHITFLGSMRTFSCAFWPLRIFLGKDLFKYFQNAVLLEFPGYFTYSGHKLPVRFIQSSLWLAFFIFSAMSFK